MTTTATLAASASSVTATITDETGNVIAEFTTKDGGNFINRLDRQMGDAGFMRSGYTIVNGVMTATVDARFAAVNA